MTAKIKNVEKTMDIYTNTFFCDFRATTLVKTPGVGGSRKVGSMQMEQQREIYGFIRDQS